MHYVLGVDNDFIHTLAAKRPDNRTKLCDAVVKQFNVTQHKMKHKNTNRTRITAGLTG